MQQKNIPISILRKFENMPAFLYKGKFIIAIIIASVLLLVGCTKTPTGPNAQLEAFFSSNVLNKNFVVDSASDSTTNLTNQYSKDTFILQRDTSLQIDSSYYSGPLIGNANGVIYNGTWSSNYDYSKLVINFTAPFPLEFNFLSRAWRFIQKNFPIMQLSPWGSTDPKILYMRRL